MQHAALGRRVGLSDAQISTLGAYEAAPVYSDLERRVIRFAEELTRKVDVTEALMADLKQFLSERQLLELAVTVAAANFTNRISEAFRVDLERATGTEQQTGR